MCFNTMEHWSAIVSTRVVAALLKPSNPTKCMRTVLLRLAMMRLLTPVLDCDKLMRRNAYYQIKAPKIEC